MSTEITDFKVVRKQINNKARGDFHKSWALYVSEDEGKPSAIGYLHEYKKKKITGKGETKFVLRYRVEWSHPIIRKMFGDHIKDEKFFVRRFRIHTELVDCIRIYYEMIDCLNDFADKTSAPVNFYRSRG